MAPGGWGSAASSTTDSGRGRAPARPAGSRRRAAAGEDAARLQTQGVLRLVSRVLVGRSEWQSVILVVMYLLTTQAI